MSSTIGIRIDRETEERLEMLSKSLKLKKSQLLRRAFNEWAKTRENIVGQNMMLCDSLLLAALFEKLEDDEISDIAEIMSDHIVSKIRIRQIEKNIVDEPLPEFLSNFTKLVSSEHFGWFDDVNFSHEPDDQITIYGFHSLNLQYSTYAVEIISLILSKTHGYRSDETALNVTENSFIVKLIPI